jgi:hypothetical protein
MFTGDYRPRTKAEIARYATAAVDTFLTGHEPGRV